MGGIGAYRFGFNGKEKDTDGEWGKLTHYDYGFRIYNPGIGKFLSVDPIAKDYPWYTPYQFAGNMPIQAMDLDGLEPLVEDGILIGYNVQKSQGPSQISVDINNPETQKKYGYTLTSPINWKVLVAMNTNKFENVFHGTGDPWDANNSDYRSGNIQPNDELRFLINYAQNLQLFLMLKFLRVQNLRGA